jgi:RHS repeat-associated protein
LRSTSSAQPPAFHTWDADNLLTEVGPADDVTLQSGDTKVAFVYDYQGRRIGKTVYVHNGTTWTLDSERCYAWGGWLLLLETDGSDQVLRKYTWGLDLAGLNGAVNSRTAAGGIGGLVGIEDGDDLDDDYDSATNFADGSGSYYVNYDGNGNVVQLVAWASGYGNATDLFWHTDRMVARYEYDPYGDVAGPDTNGDGVFDSNDAPGDYAATNAWRFSTKQFDDETGFGYWGYRYYSTELGRWLNRDPIGEAGAINLYASVANRVPLAIDPLGTCVVGPDGSNTCGPSAPARPRAGQPTSATEKCQNVVDNLMVTDNVIALMWSELLDAGCAVPPVICTSGGDCNCDYAAWIEWDDGSIFICDNYSSSQIRSHVLHELARALYACVVHGPSRDGRAIPEWGSCRDEITQLLFALAWQYGGVDKVPCSRIMSYCDHPFYLNRCGGDIDRCKKEIQTQLENDYGLSCEPQDGDNSKSDCPR